MKKITPPHLFRIRPIFRNLPPGGVRELFARNPEWVNPYSISVFFIILSFGVGFFQRGAWVIGVSWFLYLLFSYLMVWKRCDSLYLKREFSKSAREGDELPIQYKLENRGTFTFSEFYFDDHFSGNKEYRWRYFNREKLKAKRSRKIDRKILLDNGMGTKEFKDIELYLWDFLGIFTFKITFTFEESGVEVLPLVNPFPHGWERAQEDTPNFGGLELSAKGDSTNFEGIREYRDGDPLRYINWMASQRTDKILVNEFDKMVDAHTTLFVNDDLRANSGDGAMSSFEYCKDLALTIAQDQLEKGNKLRLVTMDQAHHMGSGDDFFQFLELYLCNLIPKDFGQDKRRGFGAKLFEFVPRGGTLIYLSPIHYGEYLKRDIRILKDLSLSDRKVIVVFINPYAHLYKEIQSIGRITVAGLVEGAKKNRALIEVELKKAGIFSYTIDIEERIPFKDAIKELGLKHLLFEEVLR